ncbi:hypothetical protein SteCoe_37660 [Stentor coeruleus]|uniref:RING-CH-type domain-containing protein n=1 Tax=Stentor coeruleus TaxID=5963 RepID=A0A1R2AMY5_9CILI|nr:hypothetical protein SteCoe_37660 [Stentor coeruleus]
MEKTHGSNSEILPIANSDLEKSFCRICYESGTDELLNPCKCNGSLKHIHEKCLKIWIEVKFEDITKAKCEMCNYSYMMKINQQKQFNPKKGAVENFGYCCIIPVLIFIILVMSIIVIIISVFKIDFQENLAYSIVMLCICLFPIIGSFVMLFFAIKRVLYVIETKEWCILEYREVNNSTKVIPS